MIDDFKIGRLVVYVELDRSQLALRIARQQFKVRQSLGSRDYPSMTSQSRHREDSTEGVRSARDEPDGIRVGAVKSVDD
jgi:hypothetical protein